VRSFPRECRRPATVQRDLRPVTTETLDGLFVWTSTLGINVGLEIEEKFRHRFNPLPVVSYLIEVHARRRIGFVRGPASCEAGVLCGLAVLKATWSRVGSIGAMTGTKREPVGDHPSCALDRLSGSSATCRRSPVYGRVRASIGFQGGGALSRMGSVRSGGLH